jgi:hypothetical protein
MAFLVELPEPVVGWVRIRPGDVEFNWRGIQSPTF